MDAERDVKVVLKFSEFGKIKDYIDEISVIANCDIIAFL